MHWPIRNQILLPFAIVQTLAVAVLSVSAAWMAADRAEREAVGRLERVVATLSTASFPVRVPILQQMKGLSGADYVASDSLGRITATTLDEDIATRILSIPQASTPTGVPGSGRLGQLQPITAGDQAWLMGTVQILQSPELKQLLVLVPEQQWQSLRQEVILPPLMIGAVTLLVMVSVSFWLAARMGGRLKRMQQHVQQLASLEFDQLLPVTGSDELHELATSINRMAQDLQNSTRQIRLSERTSLVTQVAGGLAHQLRNSITGARMAVQLHLRRCRDADRESLNVALRQLSLTENQIRGLLRLTRDAQQPPVAGRLDQLLRTIEELLHPQCQHSNIRLAVELPSVQDCERLEVADSEQMQASLLNLVQNAVEAAGPGGHVIVQVSVLPTTIPTGSLSGKFVIRVDVLDSGPGVSEELRSRIFEPFVTGKPEGVGLGLTLAAQTAEDHGGSLAYERIDGLTRFRFEIASDSTGV